MKKIVRILSFALLLASSIGARAGYSIGPPSTVGSLAWSFTAQSGSTLPNMLATTNALPPIAGAAPQYASCSFFADMTGVLARNVSTNINPNIAVYGAIYCGKDGNFTMSGAGYIDQTPQLNFTISNPLNALVLSCVVNVGTTEGKCIATTPSGSGGAVQTYSINLVPMTSAQ